MRDKMDFTLSLISALVFVVILALSLAVHDAGAESIISCPTGMKYEASLCYQPCRSDYEGDGPLCRQECSSGYTWDGISCSKYYGLYSYYPDSYVRTTSSPTVCSSSSFTGTLSSSPAAATFTLVVSSDSQYPWWRGANDPNCNSEACVKQKGEQTNKEQIRSMNTITTTTHTIAGQTITGQWPDNSNVLAARRGQAITTPKGVIINGDLTAFWHDWQVEKYMDLYHRNDADPDNNENLKLNLLPGLGNHDYANNASDCWWNRNLEYLPLGSDGCAKNASHYIKKMVSCNLASNFPSSDVVSFDEGSLSYSWGWGQYHFIQLHNYPTYTYTNVGVSSSMTWLRGELQRAHDAGRRIVLNMHDYGEHMSQYNSEFLEAIAGKRVVAIFAGHIHSSQGYVGSVPNRPEIPIFRSGAAENNTFLLAEFGPNHMTVGVIDSTGGTPEFMNPSSNLRMRTIEFSSDP